MFHFVHEIGDRVFILRGTTTPAYGGSYFDPPEPGEVNVTSITENVVDATEAFNAIVDEDAWAKIEDAILAADDDERRAAEEASWRRMEGRDIPMTRAESLAGTGQDGMDAAARMARYYDIPTGVDAKHDREASFQNGRGTYTHIAVEGLAEFVEACVMHGNTSDEARARLVGMVEAIDRQRDTVGATPAAPKAERSCRGCEHSGYDPDGPYCTQPVVAAGFPAGLALSSLRIAERCPAPEHPHWQARSAR